MSQRDETKGDTGSVSGAGLRPLERLSLLVNRAIRRDEKSHYRLTSLGACSIAFKLRGTELMLIASLNCGTVTLLPSLEGKPEVQLEGGIADFLAMAQTQRSGASLAAGKIAIQGDLAIAQNIQSLIAEATFDWEEIIAERTSDVFARQIGRGLRGTLNWAKQTRLVLERDLGEYLNYEKRLVPSAREIEAFLQSSNAIASDIERLEARIVRIQQKRMRS